MIKQQLTRPYHDSKNLEDKNLRVATLQQVGNQ